jgi:phytanoyl-CoA hydroxylase
MMRQRNGARSSTDDILRRSEAAVPLPRCARAVVNGDELFTPPTYGFRVTVALKRRHAASLRRRAHQHFVAHHRRSRRSTQRQGQAGTSRRFLPSAQAGRVGGRSLHAQQQRQRSSKKLARTAAAATLLREMDRLRRVAGHVVAPSRSTAAATAAPLVDVSALPPVETEAHYEAAGWRIYRDVLDPGLIHEASQHIEWLTETHPELRPENFGHTLVADDPFWVRLVSDQRLLSIAADFIGEDIALFASHYIAKPPGDGQPVLFHQDGSYWPLTPMKVVTLWLAVDDSDSENGCMRMLPGTHKGFGLHEMVDSEEDSVLGSRIPAEVIADLEDTALDLVLKAGDVSVHAAEIVHGSHANTSDRRRGGLTIRYIPTSVEIGPANQQACFLLQGEPTPGVNNHYLPKPKFDAARHMPFKGCEDWA